MDALRAWIERYGVPLAVFNVTFRDNEQRMMRDAAIQGEIMMKAAGLVDVGAMNEEHVPGDAIHEMGGACMGADPKAPGGLGLARIRYEAQLELEAVESGDRLTVSARGKLKPAQLSAATGVGHG